MEANAGKQLQRVYKITMKLETQTIINAMLGTKQRLSKKRFQQSAAVFINPDFSLDSAQTFERLPIQILTRE